MANKTAVKYVPVLKSAMNEAGTYYMHPISKPATYLQYGGKVAEEPDMPTKRPLCNYGGVIQELAIGDTLPWSAGSCTIREVPSGTKNSVNTVFTLAATPVTGSEQIYVNGHLQSYTTHYTMSGLTITFVAAPSPSDIILVTYWT